MARQTTGTPLSDRRWRIDGDRVPAAGVNDVLVATEVERAEIAKRLGLLDCACLTLTYRLKPVGSGRFHLDGRAEAVLTQACIVTLEPVAAAITEPLDLELWPAGELGSPRPESGGDADPLADVPEPILDGGIDLGALLFETLAVAIDPYPRQPGTTFDWSDPRAAKDAAKLSPFAELARLKKPPG